MGILIPHHEPSTILETSNPKWFFFSKSPMIIVKDIGCQTKGYRQCVEYHKLVMFAFIKENYLDHAIDKQIPQ